MGDRFEVLALAGFTENEAKVARALVELGQCGAGGIIRRTGLHRELVYSALERLCQRSMASFIVRNGVKEFEIDRKKIAGLLGQRLDEIQQVIPELLASPERKKQEIRIFEGELGLRLLARELDEEADMRAIGESPNLDRLLKSVEKARKKVAGGKAIQEATACALPNAFPVPIVLSGGKTVLLPEANEFVAIRIEGIAPEYEELFKRLFAGGKK